MLETYVREKRGVPRLPYRAVKEKILGESYILSLVFADTSLIKKINSAHRRKHSATNVLSFPLSKKTGEVFMHLPTIRKEAKSLRVSFPEHTLFIYIHGLLHLKGFLHGKKMEALEKKYLRYFSSGRKKNK